MVCVWGLHRDFMGMVGWGRLRGAQFRPVSMVPPWYLHGGSMGPPW